MIPAMPAIHAAGRSMWSPSLPNRVEDHLGVSVLPYALQVDIAGAIAGAAVVAEDVAQLHGEIGVGPGGGVGRGLAVNAGDLPGQDQFAALDPRQEIPDIELLAGGALPDLKPE